MTSVERGWDGEPPSDSRVAPPGAEDATIALDAVSLAVQLEVDLDPMPGRAFAYRGSHFYMATELQTSIALEPWAYAAVDTLLRGGSCRDALVRMRMHGLNHGAEEVTKLLTQYRDLGLFQAPPHAELAAHREQAVRSLLRHQPMKMMLFVAQSCNLRCTYCYGIDGNYDDQGGLMSADTARAAVDYLLRRGRGRSHFYIYFFGGEPLMNFPVVEETVAYAKEQVAALGKTAEFGLTTNAVLLTDEVARYLVDEDFQVCISIDGAPETHDANRRTKGGGGSHAAAMAGYRRIAAISTRANQVKIRATMSHQHHDPLEMAAYFDLEGVRRYGIGSAMERVGVNNCVDCRETDLADMERPFEKLLDEIMARLECGQRLPRYNPFFRTAASLTSGRRFPSMGCGTNRNDQGIGTDGTIYPCHRFVGLERYAVGTARTGIDRDKARAFYDQFYDMWSEHCQSCWARYVCSGSCVWQHAHDDGRLRAPMRYQCESIFRSIKRSAWLSLFLAQHHPKLHESLSRANTVCGPCGRDPCDVVDEAGDIRTEGCNESQESV